jgi:integrase
MNVAKKASAEANGILQATILKNCDRTGHRPETNKKCAAGTCQHTCEPGQVEHCPHKWTVRYSVNSRQREASFGTLTEARVFQAELSTKKVTQGALFTDPRAGVKKFGDIRRQYTAKLDISADTLEVYERNYRGSGAQEMFDALPVATVARMEAEVDTLVNTTHIKKSRVYRANVLRMVQGTLDLAVRRHVIPGHQVVGIELKTYRPNAEEWAAMNAPWVFVTDEQVRQLADGITITATDSRGRARKYTKKGLGVAAWLMRCCGARIGEALGAAKADFVEREDGARVWELRWQAADDGHSQVAIKHRPAGEGRDIPVPDYVWNMIQALPAGPVCPGATRRTRYMSYVTAAERLAAVAEVVGIEPGWHAHNLRHQFASEEAASGANIADLSETLGHKSPDVTFRRYVRSMPGRLDRMAGRMNDRWATGPAPLTPARAA